MSEVGQKDRSRPPAAIFRKRRCAYCLVSTGISVTPMTITMIFPVQNGGHGFEYPVKMTCARWRWSDSLSFIPMPF
jgi:hypothetical protein